MTDFRDVMHHLLAADESLIAALTLLSITADSAIFNDTVMVMDRLEALIGSVDLIILQSRERS